MERYIEREFSNVRETIDVFEDEIIKLEGIIEDQQNTIDSLRNEIDDLNDKIAQLE